jgi:hypothetical protein
VGFWAGSAECWEFARKNPAPTLWRYMSENIVPIIGITTAAISAILAPALGNPWILERGQKRANAGTIGANFATAPGRQNRTEGRPIATGSLRLTTLWPAAE